MRSHCALFLLFTVVARADDAPRPTETVIKLTVAPRAAPKPALKIQLLPELHEMTPGNPILNYLKCFMEQNPFYHNKQSVEAREAYQTMPLKELATKNLLQYGGKSLEWADEGARMDTPDWQILLKFKKEGMMLLLPEVQQLRSLAAALKVRLRAEIAAGQFDDAIRTIKTMLALGRHLGEHPTAIGNLVGLAVITITEGPIDEMIEQPGSPNLFWALTYLPDPILSIRKGLHGERMMFTNELSPLDDRAPMSEEQLRKMVEKINLMIAMAGEGGGGLTMEAKAWLGKALLDEERISAARKRLVESGVNEEQARKFPALQVILLDEKRAFDVRRDDELKWLTLPTWQAEAGLASLPPFQKEGHPLFGKLMMTWSLRARRTQGRVEQRFALLRIVEAIRLHAASHDGKPPAKLADVVVPLPVDPFTGKPFIYKVDGQTAMIQGSAPRGEEKNPSFNVRYELTLRNEPRP
jgi:hypothetical protein